MTFGQYIEAIGRATLRKEGLTFFAFIGAVGAGIALTIYLFWVTYHLEKHNQHESVAYLAYGALLLIGVTQLSIHRLLGSNLSLNLEFWKLKARILQGEKADLQEEKEELENATDSGRLVP